MGLITEPLSNFSTLIQQWCFAADLSVILSSCLKFYANDIIIKLKKQRILFSSVFQ